MAPSSPVKKNISAAQATAAKVPLDKDSGLQPSLTSSWKALADAYMKQSSPLVKSLDAYLLFTMSVGVILLGYCVVTKFANYEVFLGSFFACLGSFVLTGTLDCGLLFTNVNSQCPLATKLG